MLKFPTQSHSHKGHFVTKKVFLLLICLHCHLNDHIRKQTFVGKIFFHSFNVQICHQKSCDGTCIKYGLRFKAQLSLWAQPLPIILTKSWCTNSGMVWTRKVVLIFTLLEWLVAMHIISDRNTGGKTTKIKWLLESNLRYSYLKSCTGLGFYVLYLWTTTAKATNYTTCLVA